MPALVVPIVGLAAVLHAAWNVILKTSGDPIRVAFRLNLVGVLLAGPIVVGLWLTRGGSPVTPEGLALAVVSGVLEAAYFVSLSTAYRHGDLSVVYPIARGSAPLLAVVVGTVVFGERLAPAGWLGVACLLVGLLVVARPWRALARGDASDAGGAGARGWLDPAIGFALLTGVLIAAYSGVDRAGVRVMDPLLYGLLLFAVATVCLWLWLTVVRPRAATTAASPAATADEAPWGRSAVAGVIAFTAYGLILIALSIAPLVVVAPLRESAIVIVSGWGAIRLAEASGRADVARRIGASVLVVVGIALLVVSA